MNFDWQSGALLFDGFQFQLKLGNVLPIPATGVVGNLPLACCDGYTNWVWNQYICSGVYTRGRPTAAGAIYTKADNAGPIPKPQGLYIQTGATAAPNLVDCDNYPNQPLAAIASPSAEVVLTRPTGPYTSVFDVITHSACPTSAVLPAGCCCRRTIVEDPDCEDPGPGPEPDPCPGVCDTQWDWAYTSVGGAAFSGFPASGIVTFLDSANCNPGSGTDEVQTIVATCCYKPFRSGTLVITASGLVETHSAGFETLEVSVSSTGADNVVLRGASTTSGGDCNMELKHESASIPVSSCVVYTIKITSSTVDGLWHLGAFWSVSFSFTAT